MICLGAKYLTAAGFGRYRITAASLGSLDLLGTFGWLTAATKQAIMDAFGADGTAVIAATNEYLNGIAASDKAKATALAGFINEDPMMVCSLGLEPQGVTMPIRWLVGDGNCYIATEISIDYDDTIRTKCNVPSGQNNMMLGTRMPNGKGTILGIWSDGRTYTGWFSNNAPALNPSLAYNTDLEIEMNKDGLWYNGQKATSFDVGTNTSDTSKFHWFTCPAGSGVNANMSKGKGAYAEVVEKVKLVPFKRNGVYGTLDLVTLTYIAKSGSGSFNLEYTRNGQPWTPPTP